MRLLVSFVLTCKLCTIYLQTVLAYTISQKDASPSLPTASLSPHNEKPARRSTYKYYIDSPHRRELEFPSLSHRLLPSSRLRKRGLGLSKAFRKPAPPPPPPPPRIISIATLGREPISRAPSIPTPGSASRSGQSRSSFFRTSRGGSTTSSTPGSASAQKASPSIRQTSRGSAIPESTPSNKPASLLNRIWKKLGPGPKTGSTAAQKTSPPARQTVGESSIPKPNSPLRALPTFRRLKLESSIAKPIPPQRASPPVLQAIGESSIPKPAPPQRPSSSSPSKSVGGQAKPILKPEPASSHLQRPSPAIQRASVSNTLENPQKTFRRPEPGTVSTWGTRDGLGPSRASSKRPSRSDLEATGSNPPQRPNTVLNKPHLGIIPSFVYTPPKPNPPNETPSRSKPPAKHIPQLVPGSVNTQPIKVTPPLVPGSVNTQPIKAIPQLDPPGGVFTRPPTNHKLPAGFDSVFTRPPNNHKLPINPDSVWTRPLANHKQPINPDSVFTRPLAAATRKQPPISPNSVFTRPPGAATRKQPPISPNSIFTQPIRENMPTTYEQHIEQRTKTTPNNPPLPPLPASNNQPAKPPPLLPSRTTVPRTNFHLSKANKATSNFYARLATASDNPPNNNNNNNPAGSDSQRITTKQHRYGLLSEVHNLASTIYAQDHDNHPHASADAASAHLKSTTVPSLLESAPDPKQHIIHKATAEVYSRLVSHPYSTDTRTTTTSSSSSSPPVPVMGPAVSAKQQGQYKLLADYHHAVSRYYDEPPKG